MPRTNFTDEQKAEIYVRDRATCAFSGTNLWLLDSGAAGYYYPDWADHVKPASGGGLSAVDNGVCASHVYNYAKSDSPYPGVQLFSRGYPTPDFFVLHGELTLERVKLILRFAKLHDSDWFFNRAIWLVCLGVSWLYEKEKGVAFVRDDTYYAKAALKRIQTWRRLVQRDTIASLERRGLAPKPVQNDQRLLLSIRETDSVQSVKGLMADLLPYHAATREAVDELINQLYGAKSVSRSGAEFMRALKKNAFVTTVVRRRVMKSARLFLG
jgi:hypothetical protein